MPSVAIVGASHDRTKYGNRAVRAYVRGGWTVYPVNPRGQPIEGLPSFASVADLPVTPDRASVYLPPHLGITVLADIKAKGIKELYINPGAESDALVAEAERLGLNPILACSIVEIGERP